MEPEVAEAFNKRTKCAGCAEPIACVGESVTTIVIENDGNESMVYLCYGCAERVVEKNIEAEDSEAAENLRRLASEGGFVGVTAKQAEAILQQIMLKARLRVFELELKLKRARKWIENGVEEMRVLYEKFPELGEE